MSNVIILAPATTKALTTVEAVRARFGVTQAQIPDDRIRGMIGAASAQAAIFCRRSFGLQTVRERMAFPASVTPPDTLCVAVTPIVEIRSIAVNGEIVEPLEYEHNDTEVMNLDDDGESVPWYGRSFTLIYRAGYVLPGMDRTNPSQSIPENAPDVPEDLVRAVMLLIGANVSGDDRDVMIKAEETEKVGRTEYYVQGARAAMAHPEAEAILRGYQLANI